MNPFTIADSTLEQWLEDDGALGDATVWGLGFGERQGTLAFHARQAQTLCGSEEAIRMGALRQLTPTLPSLPSGSVVAPGTCLLALRGRLADLHAVWKPAQTLMEYAGGIASATAELVAAARKGNPQCAVACTRKTPPGTKAISIKAILTGGAVPHRLGRSETLLVFAEHRQFLDETPETTIRRLQQVWPEKKIVVEVHSAEEALHWIHAGADVIQLEKCPPEVIAQVVASARSTGTRIAAAGGINTHNAEAYARAGAHLLVTSAPYTAPPRDIQVVFAPA